MSVVVAKFADDGFVYIGADTQCSRESTVLTHTKLFVDASGTIFGYIGTVEEGQLLKIFNQETVIASVTEKGIVDYLFLFCEWVEKYRGQWSPPLNEYIIAKGGKVFVVSDGFGVEEVREDAAIGSGTPFALGALHMGATVTEAIEAAARFDMYCSLPIDIESMKVNGN
jgi:ATP-dependent protease HslVU (ClpYQ) peptidase subunit